MRHGPDQIDRIMLSGGASRVDGFREMLHQGGMPLVSVDDVAGAFFAVLAARCTGECFFVQPGRASEPFRFPSVPGPR